MSTIADQLWNKDFRIAIGVRVPPDSDGRKESKGRGGGEK